MDTIDELGRRAARTALAEAEAYTDVEAGLARILADEDDVDWNIGGDRRRGWVAVLAAAAAVVAAVTAGVVWSQDDPSPRLVPATPPAVTPAPTTPATPQPTTPATPEPQPAEPSGLAVSYRDPPPLLEPTVFATVASDPSGSIAATEGGGAVLTSPSAGVATLVALDGTTRTVPLDLVPSGSPMVAGPGDVLYGLVFETDPPSARMVAIALSGERAGEVLATSPVEIGSYTELPADAFGHGAAGVIDRARRVGQQVIGYVDPTGEPTNWPGVPPPMPTIDENDVVRLDGGSVTWPLDIDRHPEWTRPYGGGTPPAPTAGGGLVYRTTIGPPPVDPGSDDYPETTMPVVAMLSGDGTGQWYRLPDGWSVAASDVWGTILTRGVGDQVELATLTPPGEAPPPPATTTAPPAAASPLATLAETIGASTAIAREPGQVTVFASGSTTEVATPQDVYVETDGTMLWWDIVTGPATSRSAAATLDGTIVCEVEGSIHRVRQDPDGGYVASVERRDEIAGIAEERAVPNYAVDCETGETQPIEPVSWLREAGSRFVQRVGERTFTGIGDAEGNADMTNEAGISINGEDYAGYHEFSADGSRVVYGDMTDFVHVTTTLRSRDTTTGELLWSTELDQSVGPTYWYGDHIVALAPGGGVPGGEYEAAIVLDAATGEVIDRVPTSIDLAFVE